MMHDKEDFFSPEQVDERLDFSLLLHDTPVDAQEDEEADLDLLLIHDLRYLYSAQGTENVRSLQRVWERLVEQRTNAQESAARISARRGNLRLLKPHEDLDAREIKRRLRRVPGRGLAALAAMLFLVIMIGSLLAIVHLMRSAQPAAPSIATSTPSQQSTPVQLTAIPGYPYPVPGQNLAVSPASPDVFSALAWSPDGKYVAVSTQGKIWRWDLSSAGYTAIFAASSPEEKIAALAWSPNGHYLAVGSNPIQVIDPPTGKPLWDYSADYPYTSVPGQTTLVTALSWSPDGSMLAMATKHISGQCFVNVWRVSDGNPLYAFSDSDCANGISSISWSSDSKYIASADGQSIQAWDAHTGFSIFQHTITSATNVAWSPGAPPDAGELAFVDHGSTEVWNVWSGQLVSSYPGTVNGVLAWSPNGNYLATASERDVIIYNAQSGVHLYTYTGNSHYISSLAWSLDGSALACGEGGATGHNFARIWSA